ncbi:MAG: mevalonate kinase [Thaumarchaeota archaeon]|nr:mevalonate kinase [Nitrososphaerota archaeon]
MKWAAWAPGKTILIGEHFVVHGAYALAAALTKGVTVQAEPFTTSKIISEQGRLRADSLEDAPDPLKPIAAAVQATLRHLDENRGVALTITSDLPRASGLGSSSAVAVASVAATATSLGHQLTKQELAELASVSEKMVHGNPSGVDVAVAIHGGLMLFKKGSTVKPVHLHGTVDLVVGVSGVERRTKVMVEEFAKMKNKYPNSFMGMVNSSSKFSQLAAESLVKRDLETVGSVFNYQHTVLKTFGMSTDLLDKMVEEALRGGALGAKLTGAGGGGSIIALPPNSRAGQVVQALRAVIADAFITKIPAEGVKTWRQRS